MKIKTKLIISFCIIMFVPLFFAMIGLFGFNAIQIRMIEENYGIKNVDTYGLTNSIQILNRYTKTDFEQMQRMAKEEPEAFLDRERMSDWNNSLIQKSSYLVVCRNGEVVYNGGENNESVLHALKDGGMDSGDAEVGTYLDGKEEVLVKQVTLPLQGESAFAYIVTTTRGMIPEMKSLLGKMMIAIILILLLTSIVLILWVYRSIVIPIKKLQNASEQIKDGNLDFSVDVSGEDELGKLGVSFEEMRQRLKDNAAEKIQDERENRVLISNIAHDLKTPITAVKGYAEGIMDGVANTPEKVEKYVRTIYNKATEMDTLINELTLYSKIDTNRIPYNFTKITVADYFSDCVEEIGLELDAKGISLGYYNYADEQTVIIADPEQLRRVIHNIIGNSVKYMNKKEGHINIRIKDVGDFIQVEMEDNGRGIAQRDLPYIFDRFYRTDASRNSATGGSGIGLSIVKKIIEDHGGKIWATSKEDTGTVMYFVLRKYEETIVVDADIE